MSIAGTWRSPSDRRAPKVRGVYTIMPTPFDDRGRLDEDSLARLTDFLIGRGVDGLTVLGFLGEAHKLSEAEQETVVATVAATAAGRVPVYAGASAGGVSLGVQRGLRFLELGAGGLMVAPVAADASSVRAQFRVLDEAMAASFPNAPVIVHDYPAATGIRLGVDLLARLHDDIEVVTTVKLEDPPTGTKVTGLRAAGSDIGVLGGLGGLYLVEELARGADGVMTGLSFPELLVRVTRAHQAGDAGEFGRARAEYFDAAALLRFEFQPVVGLAIRKEVYRRRGALSSAYVRPPGAQVDPRLAEELDRVLEHVALELRPTWSTSP